MQSHTGSSKLLVETTNRLMQLTGMGDRKFENAEELKENASSLLVAVFEVVFATRIADITRRPTAKDEYAVNAQLVLDSMRAILPERVTFPVSVTGDAIASGNLPAISFCMTLFTDVVRVMKPQGRAQLSPPAPSTSDATAMALLRSQLSDVRSPSVAPAPVRASGQRKVAPPAVPQAGPKTSFMGTAGKENMEGTAHSRDTAAHTGRETDSRAAVAVARQQAYVMKRMMKQNEEELHHIQTMLDSAIKTREAEVRVAETSAIHSATVRAKSAKHERKVMALRTQRVLENMARHTLSMRIARSSRQASASQSLLRAVAAQQRLGAAAKIKAAADEQAADLMSGQARIAWLNQAARAVNEVVMEETQKQVAQRQAAIRSQKEALQSALASMRVDESALLEAMKREQAHAEAVFLAQNVEPMETEGGGAGLGMVDGAALVAGAISPMDTDASTQRVDTVNRVQRHLGKIEEARTARMATTNSMMRDIALDTGKLLGEAEVTVLEAQAQVDNTAATMRALAGGKA